MSAPQPVPGSSGPGALPVEGQAGRAGELALEPSLAQEQRLAKELENKLIEACMPLVDAINIINSDPVYPPEMYYAFRVYRFLLFGKGEDYIAEYVADTVGMDVAEAERLLKKVNERKARSVMKAIEACNREQKLLDFIPSLGDDIKLWEARARVREDKEVEELLERLKTMSLGEFLSSWDSIIEKLEENEYYELACRLENAIDFESRLADFIFDEIKSLAKEQLNATEEQAEKLVMCLVEC